MNITDLAMLLALVPLLASSGAISATETALFSIGYAERVRLSKQHPTAGRAVERLLARPRALLITILLVNNLVNVTYFVVCAVLTQGAESAGVAAAISLGSLLGLVLLGEVLPKLLARGQPARAALILAPPFLVVFSALRPMLRVLDGGIVAPLLRVIWPPRAASERRVSTDELSALLELSARSGHIEAPEQRLLAEVVELGTIRVREVMKPRVDMKAIEEDATGAQIAELVRVTGHDSFPVCRGGIDGKVLGVLDATSYLTARALRADGEERLRDHIRKAPFVPEVARLDQLLDQIRGGTLHQAIVVNEFGGVVGLVELKDVVGELVRIPPDDEDQIQEQVQLVGPGRWLVGGRLPVRELAEFFLGPVGEGPKMLRRATTVGGLVILLLGRLPRTGDVVRIGNLRLEVAQVRGRVVGEVVLSVEQAGAGTGSAA